MSAAAARRTRSDQHPAVQSYRQKIDSLGEHQLADIRSLGARVREAARAIPPAAGQATTTDLSRGTRDERRDDDETLHVDIVELDSTDLDEE